MLELLIYTAAPAAAGYCIYILHISVTAIPRGVATTVALFSRLLAFVRYVTPRSFVDAFSKLAARGLHYKVSSVYMYIYVVAVLYKPEPLL